MEKSRNVIILQAVLLVDRLCGLVVRVSGR
jgi:hypothetical protein